MKDRRGPKLKVGQVVAHCFIGGTVFKGGEFVKGYEAVESPVAMYLDRIRTSGMREYWRPLTKRERGERP